MEYKLTYDLGCNDCLTSESIIKNLTYKEYESCLAFASVLKTEYEIIKELLTKKGHYCLNCNSRDVSYYNLKINAKNLGYKEKPFYLELMLNKSGSSPFNVTLGGSDNSGLGFLGRAFDLIENELINCLSDTFSEKENGNAQFVVSHTLLGDSIEIFRHRGISKNDLLHVLSLIKQDMKNANPRGFQ
jgi:hypothetical protein